MLVSLDVSKLPDLQPGLKLRAQNVLMTFLAEHHFLSPGFSKLSCILVHQYSMLFEVTVFRYVFSMERPTTYAYVWLFHRKGHDVLMIEV